jgi:hypothetical protein
MRKRTIRLYRLTDDGTIAAASPAELVAHWRAFLATAATGVYIARYRGETLSLETAAEAAHIALAA